MAPPLTGTAEATLPSKLRPWLSFLGLTVVLTGAGLLVLHFVRPTAVRSLFSRSDPVDFRRGQALNNLKWIHEALLVYAHEHKGQYPETLDALAVPAADGKTYFGDRREVPLDPWKRPFGYEPPTAAHPLPRLITLGADGKPGGEGEDADIDSDALQLDR